MSTHRCPGQRTVAGVPAGLGRRPYSLTNRLDVTETNNFQFQEGKQYIARFGFFMHTDARCAMVLDDQYMSPKTALDLEIIRKFYLNESIEHLALDAREVKQSQLVVAVDRKTEVVARGIFYGKSGIDCLIFCPDLGTFITVISNEIYATTELAAKTEFLGFFCDLYNLKLFAGSSLVPKSFVNAAHAQDLPEPIIKYNMPCQIQCLSGGKIPVVDLSPEVDGVPMVVPYNREMASYCTADWAHALRPKKVGDPFNGSVTRVSDSGRLYIQLDKEGDDNPAWFMEKYLRQFTLESLRTKLPRVTRESAERGRRRDTIYIVEFDVDEVFYRAKLIDVHNVGVSVEFIDYGNTTFVKYDRIFKAEGLDHILTLVPPLVFQAHPCSVIGPVDKNGAAVLKYFQETEEKGFFLTFKIREGNNEGIPLVTISGTEENGGHYDVIPDLCDRKLVTLRISRNPVGSYYA